MIEWFGVIGIVLLVGGILAAIDGWHANKNRNWPMPPTDQPKWW